MGELCGDTAVVATDVGKHQMWTAQSYPFRPGMSWLTSGAGDHGLRPAHGHHGAALAAPERKVVCVSGDGNFTHEHQGWPRPPSRTLDVTVVLLNNVCLEVLQVKSESGLTLAYAASCNLLMVLGFIGVRNTRFVLALHWMVAAQSWNRQRWILRTGRTKGGFRAYGEVRDA